MVTIKIDTSDAKRLLDKLEKDLPILAERVVDKATYLLQQEAKRGAPVRTGNLRNNIEQITVKLLGNEVLGGIISNAPYSSVVESRDHYMEKSIDIIERRIRSIIATELKNMGY